LLWLACLLVVAGLVAIAGCGPRNVPPTACVWVVPGEQPEFDPAGPPEPVRWAIERLLTRGLVEEDSSGRIVPAAAARVEIAEDSLLYVFHLRDGLLFSDGTRCQSADFKRALETGLRRTDHGTYAWALAAVREMDRLRVGKPFPRLGIETPDDSTLTVRLSRPDPLLLRKLALPGMSTAWKAAESAGWKNARGIGAYRVLEEVPGQRLRLVLGEWTARASHPGQPDTIMVRFERGTGRVRSLLRAGRVDLVWPLPPGLLDEPLPGDYHAVSHEATPQRVLLLVMRADLPPTTKLAARHALAHGINRGELIRALGPVAGELGAWLPGADRFEFPMLDGEEVRRWLDQGKLGRSFHVVMAYDADGPAASTARLLQGGWARLSIYVELEPLRRSNAIHEFLRARAHLLLVESQSLLDNPMAALAGLVMPLRGPAVGGFRTGWRTREFDPWLMPRGPVMEFSATRAQDRLEEEMVALPLGRLPWVWVEREGAGGARLHPHFGPECAGSSSTGERSR